MVCIQYVHTRCNGRVLDISRTCTRFAHDRLRARLGDEPTLVNWEYFMPTARLPTPFERSLLKRIAKPPTMAMQFSRVRIGPDHFRTKRCDRRFKTCERYLKAKFHTDYLYRGRALVDGLETRYAELTDVILLRLTDDRWFTLLRANWYKSGAASLDPDTRNVILDTSGGFDTGIDSIVEAQHIAYQVVLSELPVRQWGEAPRCVVLDRYFDSRIEIIAAMPPPTTASA
jgi:hypothetical protein